MKSNNGYPNNGYRRKQKYNMKEKTKVNNHSKIRKVKRNEKRCLGGKE